MTPVQRAVWRWAVGVARGLVSKTHVTLINLAHFAFAVAFAAVLLLLMRSGESAGKMQANGKMGKVAGKRGCGCGCGCHMPARRPECIVPHMLCTSSLPEFLCVWVVCASECHDFAY